ncbi:MAG TPA: hypothetical protein VI197_33410 [Polyangiaceae bacterium]
MSESNEPAATGDTLRALRRRHLRFGWYALLGFLALGAALEGLHGFKAGFYLDVTHETRRLMWRLAHAHGTLLALVNVAFALSLEALTEQEPARLRFASACLLIGALLVPLGFFAGGVFAKNGDPELFVLLVPLGALLLFLGVLQVARRT